MAILADDDLAIIEYALDSERNTPFWGSATAAVSLVRGRTGLSLILSGTLLGRVLRVASARRGRAVVVSVGLRRWQNFTAEVGLGIVAHGDRLRG